MLKYFLFLMLFVLTSISYGKLHSKADHFIAKEIWVKPDKKYVMLKLFDSVERGKPFWTKVVDKPDGRVHFNGPGRANYYKKDGRDWYCSTLLWSLIYRPLGTYEFCICSREGGYSKKGVIIKDDYVWVKIHLVKNIPPLIAKK